MGRFQAAVREWWFRSVRDPDNLRLLEPLVVVLVKEVPLDWLLKEQQKVSP